jgi:hypothetical protein
MFEKCRVIVEISNPERFTATAHKNLNGKPGTIEAWSADNKKCLVRFDTPAEKLYAHGLPVDSFWFKTSDLSDIGNHA